MSKKRHRNILKGNNDNLYLKKYIFPYFHQNLYLLFLYSLKNFRLSPLNEHF